jgi:uncharacterized protein YndB with AHSA1/START domain
MIPATIELPSSLETVVTRRFRFPPSLVFEMWTNPVHVPRWYGMSSHIMSDCQIDLRVGGRWRWAQRNLDGDEVAFSGSYLEIDRPNRLVFTEEFEAMPGSEYIVTMTFARTDDGTLLTTHMLYQSQEHRDGHLQSGMEEGTNAIYAQLDRVMDDETPPTALPDEVRAYIGAVRAEHRDLFDELHALALANVADVEVVYSYKMPAYVGANGRVSLSDGPKGVSISTRVPEPVAEFHARHPEFKVGKVSVLFPPGKPLPVDDVAALIRQAT